VADWLYLSNNVEIVDSNWRWFRALVNASLRKLGEKWCRERLDEDLSRLDEFHLGNGWYRDEDRIDYYTPMAMQFYPLLYSIISENDDPERARIYRERAELFAKDFVHWFSATGTAVPFGRSLIYRSAQCSFWGALAFAKVEALPWGAIKGLLLRNLRWWLNQPIFSETGLLTIGYRFSNSSVGENYNAYGSPYWALKAFLPLALPESHPFWQAAELPMPAKTPVAAQPLVGMTLCHDENSGHVFGLNQGQAIEKWPRHCAHEYGKCAYSATFGFGVAEDDTPDAPALTAPLRSVTMTAAIFDCAKNAQILLLKTERPLRHGCPWPDVPVRTWLVAAFQGT